MSKKMQAQIDYWRISASRNWETAKGLLKLKHYDACLFYCHLVIEKMLKGLVVKRTRQEPPHIHHLERLAHLAGLKLDEKLTKQLLVITGFNIAARYGDVKFNFYKKCTKEYTEENFVICENIYLWLKKYYQEN